MSLSDLYIKGLRDRHSIKSESPVGVLGVLSVLPSLEGDNRTVSFIATTVGVDLDDEVVIPGGIDWSYFLANGQVFVDHRYDSEYNVGYLPEVEKIGNNRGAEMIPYMEGGRHVGWKMRVNFYNGLKCPRADDTLAKILQNRQGASIGFQPLDYGALTAEEAKIYKASSIVRRSRAVEVSITPLPCNVKCQSGKSFEADARKPLIITPERKPLVIG